MEFALISDTHIHAFQAFGEGSGSSNSRVQESMKALDFVTNECVRRKITTLIHAGDVFHTRDYQRFPVFNTVLDKFKFMHSQGLDIHIVVGNHDIVDSEETLTLHALRPFATVHTEPILLPDNILLLPYTTDYETLSASINRERKIDTDGNIIVIGHVPLKGMQMGGTKSTSGWDIENLDGYGVAYWGHYHTHQSLIGIGQIIGPLTPVDFGELDQQGQFLIVNTAKPMHPEVVPTKAPMFVDAELPDPSNKPALVQLAKRIKGNYIRAFHVVDAQWEDWLTQNGARGVVFKPPSFASSTESRISGIEKMGWHDQVTAYVDNNLPDGLDGKKLVSIGNELLK